MKRYKMDLSAIELTGAEFDIAVGLAKILMQQNGFPDTLETFKIAHTAVMAGMKLERSIKAMPADERAQLFATAQKHFDEVEAGNQNTTKHITTTNFTS